MDLLKIARVASLLLLFALSSCALVVSFDDYGGSAEKPATVLRSVRGIVEGLGDARVVLRMNGATREVGDGSFAFESLLADGDTYDVTVPQDPARHTCNVAGGSGRIDGADAAGVVVRCPSTDVSLASITASAAPVAPTYDAATATYRARAYAANLQTRLTTTVTLSPTDAGARMQVGGRDVLPGVPSAPISLTFAPNAIAITVTAADGKTQARHTLVVSVDVGHYIKASNNRDGAGFGHALAISGNTLVVGAPSETSRARGVGGNQADTSGNVCGAAYVFTRTGDTWTQQAYLKASNTADLQQFGARVAISGDIIAVAASGESSAARGIDGDQSDVAGAGSGAVYVFARTGTTWSQQAHIKPPATVADFGSSIALSGDTLVVGSPYDPSGSIGTGGDPFDVSAPMSGAAFVYTRSGSTWSQQAYIKPPVAGVGLFGLGVAVDSSSLVVGSLDDSADRRGAADVWTRSGTTWTLQAHLKASRPANAGAFGAALAISGDTIVAGAPFESSNARGVDGDPDNSAAYESGAAYVFRRIGTAWSQQAYLKASNTPSSVPAGTLGPHFGEAVAVSGDRVAVGASLEASGAVGVDGDQTSTLAPQSGAVYLFTRSGEKWSQAAYVKASNTRGGAAFGLAVGLTFDTLVVGALNDASRATGIDGDQKDTSLTQAGAVYTY